MMNETDKQVALKDLRRIPGVGKSIAQDLWDLGFHNVAGLKDQNPQTLYEQHCQQKGMLVDRCMLYVFRCAVYFASNETHEPELLKWWNWHDAKMPVAQAGI